MEAIEIVIKHWYIPTNHIYSEHFKKKFSECIHNKFLNYFFTEQFFQHFYPFLNLNDYYLVFTNCKKIDQKMAGICYRNECVGILRWHFDDIFTFVLHKKCSSCDFGFDTIFIG